jgi:hypothetical protein
VKKEISIDNITDWIPTTKSLLVKQAVRQIKSKQKQQSSLRPASDDNEGLEKLKKSIPGYFEIIAVNTVLRERGLIESRGNTDYTSAPTQVSLTISGYDLGRKYNSWCTRSGLWFAEYKDHWFWLVLSFLGGIIGALVVNWLSN